MNTKVDERNWESFKLAQRCMRFGKQCGERPA